VYVRVWRINELLYGGFCLYAIDNRSLQWVYRQPRTTGVAFVLP